MFQLLLSKLSSILKSADGQNWSSNRVAFLFSVLISNISVFGCWLFLSILNNELLAIPESVLILYCFANSIALSGKLIQKTMEK